MTPTRRSAVLALVLLALALVGGLPDGPQAAPVFVAALAALGAAAFALQVAATAPVPARVRAPAATWPGHPPRRAGGDLPRQQHPDSAGRSRSRAPGGARPRPR